MMFDTTEVYYFYPSR
ncbi:Putative uncharacterized protein [Escherichia coli D6-117.29]|nr:Protein of unknown function [Escherichia coli D6-113.11]CDP73562.1 Protein of unknown function [Escherichia coli]CDP76805.1 Putative uncharacterized protein [Escherichia coli D6-117.29]CDU32854.1 Protein of unknown function [Escherichia coli D6-113.11]CDU40753.1 Protein of unknown function [Escherichia coli]